MILVLLLSTSVFVFVLMLFECAVSVMRGCEWNDTCMFGLNGILLVCPRGLPVTQ
jgi:hypothetical protein